MARQPILEFWYEFASTYSYLAAMRVEAAAAEAGVAIRWRPFLVGPLFASQGWTTSPFNLYPAKGKNMWRDVEREAARLDLPPLTRPAQFPQNSLSAVRVAVYGQDQDWLVPFTKAVFRASFAEGRSIAEPTAVAEILDSLGLDGTQTVRAAAAESNKTKLRVCVEEARSRGIYGAPTFLADDGELFWGNDRLELALAWATGDRPKGLK
ncbi:2-hydroxychromene-2-carboxylate isomerase [Methylobacterium mesophilicum SR1.6/6]|uniref:2-hydroxychromene-2-carboxylate isomerase n=1 Tax=Methylobacterium mesophilicum SR1.6/6 TaxID=908290 RepID=A0A6B9FRS4_9HYPH|nr:2-hydroxychromene-2-carboxylate isomerase [Methylobacterium mesophilicum]QGY05290.1 2-hydroxychromene-2-carboxylate isomerase [Methylobacterium mesophilicum SR1.6/6]